MVSLGNESGRTGGYFFDGVDQSFLSNDSEDILHEGECDALLDEIDPPYRRINTTWAIVLQIVLMICLGIIAFVDTALCKEERCAIETYQVTVYSHASTWFFLLAIDRYISFIHNRSRISGYLEFYRKTKNIRRLPFLINSFANVILVYVVTLISTYCRPMCGSLDKSNVLQIIVSVEVFTILLSITFYLYRTVQFNKACAVPDAQREDLATSYTHSHAVSSEIGFKDEDYVDQVLERQADMIHYLKLHSSYLAKRVLALTSELNQHKSQS